MFSVEVILQNARTKLRHMAENTYTFNGMFCVVENGRLYRYPLSKLFQVVEHHSA